MRIPSSMARFSELWSLPSTIDPLHDSKNIPVRYPTMHHFNRNVHITTCVHISASKWDIVIYLSNALWDLWDGFIGRVGLVGSTQALGDYVGPSASAVQVLSPGPDETKSRLPGPPWRDSGVGNTPNTPRQIKREEINKIKNTLFNFSFTDCHENIFRRNATYLHIMTNTGWLYFTVLVYENKAPTFNCAFKKFVSL